MAGNKSFFITDADKEWVHECFDWLIKAYGYPDPDFTPILFNDHYFPHTISHKQTAIDPLLTDLCNLFEINRTKISFEIEEDIRDSYGTPFQIHGEPFESDLELITSDGGYHYKLFFAKSLLKTPKRLLFNAVFHFIQIRLSKTDPEWIGNKDHYFLFYLIGIYTGWGVILAQTMTDVGRVNDGFWEETWKYISPMPIPIMAYSLAFQAVLTEAKDLSWKNFLPSDIQDQFEKAVNFINQNPVPVINKQELNANRLLKEASYESSQKNFDKAIEIYQKALFLTNDTYLKSLIYHQTGYTLLLKGDFEKSIPNFQKALEVDPNVGYPHENLSFAFIMMGDTDTGKYYQSLAKEKQRVEGYAYRNMAMYYHKRGEIEKARENFQKALKHITIPVDWLEYLYARFLFEQGEKEEALVYLQMAVEKGEPKAIQWMNEINEANE